MVRKIPSSYVRKLNEEQKMRKIIEDEAADPENATTA